MNSKDKKAKDVPQKIFNEAVKALLNTPPKPKNGAGDARKGKKGKKKN